MMTTKQKDLTQKEALALVKAKWGTLDLVFVGQARDKSWSICRNFMSKRGPMFTGASLREACERAGLLEKEVASGRSQGTVAR